MRYFVYTLSVFISFHSRYYEKIKMNFILLNSHQFFYLLLVRSDILCYKYCNDCKNR